MSELNHIHDSFFKKVFSDINNVRDFLHIALPDEVKNHIDFERINIEPNSYVSDDVKEFYSDIVVKSCIKNTDTLLDLYILFEHKSYQDKRIFIQLLHYMYLMWSHDYDNKKPLRVIIPVVFYHGKSKWKIPIKFTDQFRVNDDFKKYLLNFDYILFDTSVHDLEHESNLALRNNVYLMTALLLMKSAFKEDIQAIRNVFDFWVDKGFIKNTEQLLMFFVYITATKEIEQDKLEKLLEEAKIERSEVMPTLAQRWIEQGIEKGIEKGRLEGEKEKSIVIARNLLKKGMDTQFIIEITGLSQQDIKKLKG